MQGTTRRETAVRTTQRTMSYGCASLAAGVIAFHAFNGSAVPGTEAEALKSSERFALVSFDAASSNGVLFGLGTRHEGTQDVFCVVGVPRGFEAKGVSTISPVLPSDTPRPSVSIVGLMPFLAAAMPDTAARGSFVMFQYQGGRYSCSVACRLADTSGEWHYVKDYTIGATSLTTAVVLPVRPAVSTPECRPQWRGDSLGIGIRMPCTVTRNGKAPDASVVVRDAGNRVVTCLVDRVDAFPFG